MGLRPMTRPIYGRNLGAVSNRRGVPRPKTDWNGSCAIWSAIGNSIIATAQKALADDWIAAYHKYYEAH